MHCLPAYISDVCALTLRTMACVVDDDDVRQLTRLVSELKSIEEESDSDSNPDDSDDSDDSDVFSLLKRTPPFNFTNRDTEGQEKSPEKKLKATRPATRPTRPVSKPAPKPERPKFIPESEWGDVLAFEKKDASNFFF